MAVMRAKMVATVKVNQDNMGKTVSEVYSFNAVARSDYPDDGADENNTFAKWSPRASASITCMNPALFGKIKNGQAYYVDFTEAPK